MLFTSTKNINVIIKKILLFVMVVFVLTNLRNSYAFNLWGTAPPNGLDLGMWSFHLNPESERTDNRVNNLFCVEYHSMFLGTFINSFGDRTYAAGVHRNFYTHQFINDPNLNYTMGYRLGLMHGYDERLTPLAGKTPLFPFAQLTSDLSYKHFGWELSYTGIVISTGFFINF